MESFAITNGTIVRHHEQLRADVVIEDGVITDILAPNSTTLPRQTIDAHGALILPGAVDIHFHCRAPAYPERGDWASETRAAAAGGVTTVLEMPISKPATATADVFRQRRALGQRDAYVDFGLYAAPGLRDAAQIRAMVEEGAIGFKTFMTEAPEGRDDEFNGLCVPTEPALLQVLELIKPYGLPAVFHAESAQLLRYFEQRVLAEPLNDPADHGRSRPPVVESTAIAVLLSLAQATGCPVHIAHLSTAVGSELVRDARRRGIAVTAETCPHYLLFTEDNLREAGPFGKINPPLRTLADQRALWTALDDGTVDVVTTDHSPFTVADKQRGSDNIMLAPPGAPGVEMLYPVVLDQALAGRFTLDRAVELVATRPAQLFGLYPRKGVVDVGSDADLVLFDPTASTTVDRKRWFSRAAACDRLYSGMHLRGSIKSTYLRGLCIFDGEDVIGESGMGAFVRPHRD